MSWLLLIFTVTFTFTISVFALMSGGGEGVSRVCWVAVGRIKLGGRGRGRRGSAREPVHVSVYPVVTMAPAPGVRHAPVCRPPRVAAVLLGQVAVVVIHLVYRRISTPAPALPAPVLLVGGGGGHGHDVRGRGGAGPRVRAQRGAGARDPQLLAREVVQAGAVLLAALLGVRLRLGWETFSVREVRGGGCGRGVGTRARTEDAKEHRQEKEAVEEAERDDKENHLEESDKNVGGGDHETNNTEDCGHGALEDGQAEAVEAVPDSVVRAAGAVQIVIRNVSSEVHRKSATGKFKVKQAFLSCFQHNLY